MAIQLGGGSRDSSSNGSGGSAKGQAGIATKVAVPAGKPAIGKRPTQGISGKLTDDGKSSGKRADQSCAMGNGEIIKGVI